MHLKGNNLLESIISLSLLNVLNMVLPLVTLPYIVKVVGIANYGAYSIAYAIVQYILLVSTYGFNFSVTKQIAQCRDNRQHINRIFNATIVAKFYLTIAATIVFGLVTWAFFPITYLYMILLGIGIVLGDLLNPVWLFQGMEKMRYMTVVNFACKLLFTILIFFFIIVFSGYQDGILIGKCATKRAAIKNFWQWKFGIFNFKRRKSFDLFLHR